MASALPRIEGIALVGSRNQKLYLTSRISTTSQQSADDATAARLRNDMLRLEYAAHSALDVVEERTAQTRGPSGELIAPSVSYLGLVLTLEDLSVFAMITSTKLKILLIICPGEARIKDLDCITILRAIHTCYLSYISNAFLALQSGASGLSLGQSNSHVEIKSEAFDKKMADIGGW